MKRRLFCKNQHNFVGRLPIHFFYFEDFQWSFFGKITGQTRPIILSRMVCFFIEWVVCRQKQLCPFILTTNLTNTTNSVVGINERWRSPNKNKFSKTIFFLTTNKIFARIDDTPVSFRALPLLQWEIFFRFFATQGEVAGLTRMFFFNNECEFDKDVQHVYVGRFVSFAERLRSLSYLVDSLYWFYLLFHNIVLI